MIVSSFIHEHNGDAGFWLKGKTYAYVLAKSQTRADSYVVQQVIRTRKIRILNHR